jgi:hypothetical protein
VHFCLQPYYFIYLVIIPCIIILFLHLLSTNHMFPQPCYFPCCRNLLLRRWRLLWRILRRGVLRYALPWLLLLWSYGVFHCSVSQETHLCLLRHYLCNKYILFMTFGYLWTLFVCVCWTNDPEHTYDEYLVLHAKSGMTGPILGFSGRGRHSPLGRGGCTWHERETACAKFYLLKHHLASPFSKLEPNV